MDIKRDLFLSTREEYKIMEDFRATLAKRPWDYLEDVKFKPLKELKMEPSVHRKELLKLYSEILSLVREKQRHINSQFSNPKFDIVRHDFRCICKNSNKYKHYSLPRTVEPESVPVNVKSTDKLESESSEPKVIVSKANEVRVEELDLDKVPRGQTPVIVSSVRNTGHSQPDPVVYQYFEKSRDFTESVGTIKALKSVGTMKSVVTVNWDSDLGSSSESFEPARSDEAFRQKGRKSTVKFQVDEMKSRVGESERKHAPIQHKNTYRTEDLLKMPSLDIEFLHSNPTQLGRPSSNKVNPANQAQLGELGGGVNIRKKVKSSVKDNRVDSVSNVKDKKMSDQELEMRNDLVHLLETVPIFSELKRSRLLELTRHFKLKSYFPNTSIILCGEVPSEFYIVASGTVSTFEYDEAEKMDVYRRTYLSSDYFGDIFIIKNAPSREFFVADSHVTVQAMNSEAFRTQLSDLFEAFKDRQREFGHYATYRFNTLKAPSRFFTRIELENFASGEQVANAYEVLGSKLSGFLAKFGFFGAKTAEKVLKRFTLHEYSAREILVGVCKNGNFFAVYQGSVSMQIYDQQLERQLELVSFRPGSYFFSLVSVSETLDQLVKRSSFVSKDKVVLLCLAEKYVKKYLKASMQSLTAELESLFKNSLDDLHSQPNSNTVKPSEPNSNTDLQSDELGDSVDTVESSAESSVENSVVELNSSTLTFTESNTGEDLNVSTLEDKSSFGTLTSTLNQDQSTLGQDQSNDTCTFSEDKSSTDVTDVNPINTVNPADSVNPVNTIQPNSHSDNSVGQVDTLNTGELGNSVDTVDNTQPNSNNSHSEVLGESESSDDSMNQQQNTDRSSLNELIVSRRSMEDPVDVSIKSSVGSQLDSSRTKSSVESDDNLAKSLQNVTRLLKGSISRSFSSASQDEATDFINAFMKRMESYTSFLYRPEDDKELPESLEPVKMGSNEDYEIIRKKTLLASHVNVSDTELTARSQKPEPLPRQSDSVVKTVSLNREVSSISLEESFKDRDSLKESSNFGKDSKDSEVSSVASDVKFIFNLDGQKSSRAIPANCPNLQGTDAVNEEVLDSSRVLGNDNFICIRPLATPQQAEASLEVKVDDKVENLPKIVQRQTSSSHLLTSRSTDNFGSRQSSEVKYSIDSVEPRSSLDDIIVKNYPSVKDSIDSVVQVIQARSIQQSNLGNLGDSVDLVDSVHTTQSGDKDESSDTVKQDNSVNLGDRDELSSDMDKMKDKSPSLDFTEIPTLTKILTKVHEIYAQPTPHEEKVAASRLASIENSCSKLEEIERLYQSKSFTQNLEPQNTVDNVQDFEVVRTESLFDLGHLFRQSSCEPVDKSLAEQIYDSERDEVLEPEQEDEYGLSQVIDDLANKITDQLSLDNLSNSITLDNFAENMSLDNLAENISVENVSRQLSVEEIGKGLSNIGSSLSSHLPDVFSSKSSVVDDEQDNGLSFIESSKLIITSIFDNIAMKSEQPPEPSQPVQSTLSTDSHSVNEVDNVNTVDTLDPVDKVELSDEVDEICEVVEEEESINESLLIEKYNLLDRISSDSSLNNTCRSDTLPKSDGNSVLFVPNSSDTNSLLDTEKDSAYTAQRGLASSVELSDGFSTERESLRDSDNVTLLSSEKDSGKELFTDSVNDTSNLSTDSESHLSSTSYSEDNDQFSATNDQTTGSNEDLCSLLSSLHSNSDLATELTQATQTSDLTQSTELTHSSFNSTSDTSDGDTSDEINTESSKSDGGNGVNLVDAVNSVDDSMTSSLSSRRTSSIESSFESSDQNQDCYGEDFEDFEDTNCTVDSYEEEIEYDQEAILSIKNLLMSTLKNKYRSFGASFTAMDCENSGKVTCDVFLAFLEKLGIGAIDHREQNLMFEILKESGTEYITFASFYRSSGEVVATLPELNQHLISIFGSSRIAFERLFTNLDKSTQCSQVDFALLMSRVGISEDHANGLFEALDVCGKRSVSVFTMLKMIVGDWDRDQAVEYEENVNTNLNRLITYLSPDAVEKFNVEFTRTLSSHFFDQNVDGSLVTDSFEEFYIDRDLPYFDQLLSLVSSAAEFKSLSLAQKRFVISLFSIIDTRVETRGQDLQEQNVVLISSNELEPPLVALLQGSVEVAFDGLTFPKYQTFNTPSMPNYAQFISMINTYTNPATQWSSMTEDERSKLECGYTLTFKFSLNSPAILALIPLSTYLYNIVPVLYERNRRIPVMLEFLKFIPLFNTYSEEELDLIVTACTVRQFKLHETVIKAGEIPTHFYIVFDGSLTVTDEYNLQFKTLGKCEVFSSHDLVKNHSNGYTLIANCSVILLSWERNEFFRVFSRYANLVDADACNLDDFQDLPLQKTVDKKVSFAETP